MDATTLELVQQLNQIFLDQGYGPLDIGGSVSNAQIEEIEAQLSITLPEDYKEFLRKFGSIRFGEEGVYGILKKDPLSLESQTLLGETSHLRAESSMPHGLAVISGNYFTSYVCLNTDSPDNQKHGLVFYDSVQKAVFAYTHANTFSEFFELFLKVNIDAYTKAAPN
jgi:hypothetical protein